VLISSQQQDSQDLVRMAGVTGMTATHEQRSISADSAVL
jgi:hypothetical protein